jgi:[acyl-carrier-protein] S-malonyltransferase
MIVVVVFPGQGSQRTGMGVDFAERFAIARSVFDQASAVLGYDVHALCAEGDPRLQLTEYTQPCILAAEVAMLGALREHFGLVDARHGGHSLGEYTALVAAGALELDAALRLVRLRGRLMQSAVPAGQGGMIAVIQQDLDLDLVARVASEHEVDVANLNSPSQVVLSGSSASLARAGDVLEAALEPTGGRVVALDVSAPFHSRALRVIEAEFERALDGEAGAMNAARATSVTSNLLGGFHAGTSEALISALVRQISGPVRWIDNMKALAEGATTIYEIGPNRPLTRFFKELGHEVQPIINVRSAEKVFRS